MVFRSRFVCLTQLSLPCCLMKAPIRRPISRASCLRNERTHARGRTRACVRQYCADAREKGRRRVLQVCPDFRVFQTAGSGSGGLGDAFATRAARGRRKRRSSASVSAFPPALLLATRQKQRMRTSDQSPPPPEGVRHSMANDIRGFVCSLS